MAGLHFVLVPLLAQGHIIPMVDLARLLAGRGARVSVVTTPVNAARNGAVVESARRAGLDVELAEVAFPGPGLGLPEGMENVDMVVEKEHFMPFFQATWKMDAPLEEYLRSLPRRPDCVVADSCNPWAARVCARHGIPRLVLHCPSAYFLLATHCLSTHGVYGRVAHELEPFEVPGFPVRAAGNVATFRGFFQWPGMESYERDVAEAEATADGLLINTFRGLEGVFVDGYAAALGRKTTTTCWAVGPTCASSSGGLDAGATAARGNRADVDVGLVLSWLDARPAASVLYVSFGSLAQLSLKQTVELARGLEASGRPFVWAIKEAKSSADVRAWLLAERFEERVRDRGLLVRGWAPQVTILSHPAVGGFLSHCGWNASLEAITHGVPVLTWPNFADQFCSERLLVDVLGVGVRSGVKLPPMSLPDEAEGVQVTSADVEKAVAELMGVGADGTARRARAKELAAKAKAAMEEGGSSYADLDDMLRHVAELNMKKSHEEGTGFSTLPELGTGSKNNDNIGAGAALSVQS
ncbi:cytokinin-O-glucosyltransferase 3 [Zea mays]|uniref:Glycosyltransferase n=1 Tax=Zea mays TaxID=4577 RepID=C0PGK6_MAIZE|nr:cytokinin-O-glucosyltransferase 3 [Zea mays]ACN34322.1 unknown [Zea mays]ONM29568.1 UDP-glycosyltransferase 73D1 [Zea mays]|eukprot:NP_001148090.2 cytokinin-O-glucosyltransferase 3 [Zea mays]